MCGWGARKYRERQRELESDSPPEPDRLSKLESRLRGRNSGTELPRPAMHREGKSAEASPVGLKQRRTSPLQELQKRFVEGRLTLAEYERELDRLDRID